MDIESLLRNIRTDGAYYFFVWGGLQDEKFKDRPTELPEAAISVELPRHFRGYQYYSAMYNLRKIPLGPGGDLHPIHPLVKSFQLFSGDDVTYVDRMKLNLRNTFSDKGTEPFEVLLHHGPVMAARHEPYQSVAQKKVTRKLGFVERLALLVGRPVETHEYRDMPISGSREIFDQPVPLRDISRTERSDPAHILLFLPYAGRPYGCFVESTHRENTGLYALVAVPEEIKAGVVSHLETHPDDFIHLLKGLFPAADFPALNAQIDPQIKPAGRLMITDAKDRELKGMQQHLYAVSQKV